MVIERPHPSHTVTIRPATLADIPGAFHLEMTSFHLEGERFNRRQVEYLIRRAKGVVLVAEAGAGLLGWAVGLIQKRPGRRKHGARVYALAVHPNARGMKIGQRLLDQLLKDLAMQGVDHVWLEVREANEGAIALYEKHGFTRDRHLPEFYGKGIHGLRMVKGGLL